MSEETDNTMDRRAFVRRAGTVGAAGAMVWAAPSITTLSRAFGATPGTPDCARIRSLRPDMKSRSAPASAKKDQITSDTDVFIWREAALRNSGDGISVPNANPSTVQKDGVQISTLSIPANTPFAVYMIHAQAANWNSGQVGKTQNGGVTFTGKILGVTSTSAGLLATDFLSPVTYDQDGQAALGRRFEEVGDPMVDFATVTDVSIDVKTTQGGFPDQMRVFVECTVPGDNG